MSGFDGEFNIVHSITASNSNASSWFVFKMADKIAMRFSCLSGFNRGIEALKDKVVKLSVGKSNVDLRNVFQISPRLVLIDDANQWQC